MQQRVNYQQIAQLYDEPLRDHPVDPDLLRYLGERPDLVPSDLRILDVGCGTGKQLAANRLQFSESRMVGLDQFHAMLQLAQRRCGTCAWVQGDGARLPFPDESFDYVTSQFSYHHILDKHGMIIATFRILGPGGRLVITNLDPWSMPGWIAYLYFPAAARRDKEDFLSTDELAALLREAGFSNVRVSRQRRQEEITLGGFLAYAVGRHRTSQLMVIDDEEYRTGISALREEIEERGAEARVPSELCLVTVTADKCL